MRIGLDARAAFRDPHRGFGRVTRCLADALLDAAPGQLVLFVPHGASIPDRWYPSAARIVQLRRPRRFAWLVDPLAWPLTLRRHPVDVLHLPAWGVPPGISTPVVATFHDATPSLLGVPGGWQGVRARMAIRSVARAALVHAVSGAAEAQLRQVVPEPGDVRVVHWGVGPPFTPSATGVAPSHLLFVGGAESHKNLAVVLDALLRPGAEDLPPLVVAGPSELPPGQREKWLRLGSRVRLVPVPDDRALVDLYRGALALVLPSRNEGFGLPALEAMSSGCPVAASHAPALAEVCGDAAVLLDPDDPDAWRMALLRLARDPAHRAALIAAGLSRAGRFPWSETARAMLDVYRAAARRANSRS